MIRLTVLYPNSEGGWFDMDYYLKKHVPLVKERIASVGASVELEEGMAGAEPDTPSAFCVIGSINYKSMEDLQKVLAMHGEELLADIPNYTNIKAIMQISRLIEPVAGKKDSNVAAV